MTLTYGELEALVIDLSARVQALEGRRLRQNRIGPHVSGSPTSKAAALSNFPRSGSQRALVLECLQSKGHFGATRQEIAAETGLSDDSVRPRVVELLDGGWVVATELTRPTPMGEQAEVLVASERALAETGLKTEETRAIVSPRPVVADDSGWATPSLGGLSAGEHTTPGSSATAAQNAIFGWDGDEAA